MSQEGSSSVSEGFQGCFEPPYLIMSLKMSKSNVVSLDKRSVILMARSKNPALSQKVIFDWFMLPERQELFPGLT